MFLPDLKEMKVFIKPGVTDLRKSITGLAGIVEKQMHLGRDLGGFRKREEDRITEPKDSVMKLMIIKY